MAESPELAIAIRKAYIDSVRTVMLIDDQFPTLEDWKSSEPRVAAQAAPPEPAQESHATTQDGAGPSEAAPAPPTPAPVVAEMFRGDLERAVALSEYFRKRGWACDIENLRRRKPDELLHLHTPELIVLDLHLGPGLGRTAKEMRGALEILKRLADSDHANLVILYTMDEALADVRDRVIAHLRGSFDVKNQLPPEFWTKFDSFVAGDSREEFAPPSDLEIEGIVKDERAVWWSKERQEEIIKKGFIADDVENVVRVIVEDHLVREYGAQAKTQLQPVMFNRRAEGAQLWLKYENVFVVFMTKRVEAEGEGERLIKGLEAALNGWQPSVLQIALAYTKGLVQREGFRLEAAVLKDNAERAGWVYQALRQGPSEGIQDLYERLLDTLTHQVVSKVSDLCLPLLPKSEGTFAATMKRARELLRLDSKTKDADVIHALNAFLCATAVRNRHVGLGCMFRKVERAPAEQDLLWICVTPACDMVPREPNSSGWHKQLHPLRPMIALRGKVLAANERLLRAAENGRYVFWTIDGKRVVVETAAEPARQPKLEVFIVEKSALLDGNRHFMTYEIARQGEAEQAALSPTKIEMEALAQLRIPYANRLLHEAGHHLSRMGVDFVNFGDGQGE